jgi:outer membrane protein assembly factor BamA
MKLCFSHKLLNTVPFFLFLFWAPVSSAAKEKPSEDQPKSKSDDSRDFNWIVLPGPFSTRETGFGIGALAAVSFYPEPVPSHSNATSISLAAAYTIKEQFTIGLQPEIYWNDNEYALVAKETFKYWVDRYYGIGNRTPAVYQKYTENVIESEIEIRREHFENFYIGALHSIYSVLDFQPEEIKDDDGESYPDSSPLLNEELLGVGESFSQGLGLTLLYDHRDDIDYPFSGGYYYSSLIGYSKVLGGDYSYLKWTVDLRQYVRIIKGYRHLVALQLFHEANFGEPPFYHLAELGGPKLMRGYYEGRFRDRHMLVLQTEYRFPIYWRFHGALFGSLGEVYGESRLALSEVQASGGAGIVFRFGDNIYIRFDFGIGFEGYAIILQPKNAF